MKKDANPIYLNTYLEPFNELLSRDDVTDIYINKPGEVWIETINGGTERIIINSLTQNNLLRLSQQIAAFTHQGVNRENPLLAATLPDGSRIQIVLPPATRSNCVIAIRKHLMNNLTIDDYVELGAFENTISGNSSKISEIDKQISKAQEEGDFGKMLSLAVKARKNILVSGGTSTGKTTFLNALLREVPLQERLILIEDTPELRIEHENSVGLIAVRDNLGEALINTNDLLTASLRLRPDRIIVGELRGAEAYTFLRAINTGHPGSMSTIHADSPSQAIEQIALLVLQCGTQLNRSDIIEYVENTIDLHVQLKRESGRRFISEIEINRCKCSS